MASYSEQRFAEEERQKFRRCASRLLALVPENDNQHRQELNSLLDKLNSLDYSISGIVEQVFVVCFDYGVQNLEACRNNNTVLIHASLLHHK